MNAQYEKGDIFVREGVLLLDKSVILHWLYLVKKPVSVLERVSVDESFAVSSGLFNLVIVLVNDVKQHGLREKHREIHQWKCSARKT